MSEENIKNNDQNKTIGSAVILGGGIGGMQAALDLADSGIKVHLVEASPAIGGRMVQLDKTFPTNECAMCVVSPKLVDCARHLNIDIITNSQLQSIEGEAGNFNIKLKKKARYVDEEKCTGCGSCVINCPVSNKINIISPEERAKIDLSPEDEEKVNKILDQYKELKGSLMLILQAINALYGYFPENVLEYISQKLNTSLSNILRIGTFYNSFSLKPRGRHTISVCMGTTCYVKGSDRILTQLSENLDIPVEETTKDSRFTLRSVRCLGCCSIAPAIMVDDKVYGNLKITEIPKILKDYE